MYKYIYQYAYQVWWSSSIMSGGGFFQENHLQAKEKAAWLVHIIREDTSRYRHVRSIFGQ